MRLRAPYHHDARGGYGDYGYGGRGPSGPPPRSPYGGRGGYPGGRGGAPPPSYSGSRGYGGYDPYGPPPPRYNDAHSDLRVLCGVNTPGLLVVEATTGTITAIPLATAAVVVATPLRPTQLMEGEQLPTICLRAAMVAVVLTTGAFILSLAGVVFIVLISQTLGIPHMMIGTYESGTITDRAPTTSGTVATKVMIVPVYTMNAIGIAVAP